MRSLSWRSAHVALTVVLLLLGAGVALAASRRRLDARRAGPAGIQPAEGGGQARQAVAREAGAGRGDDGAHADTAKGRLSGTAEFKPDGTVVFVDGKGRRRTGRWTQEGDTIHAHGEGGQDYVGTLEGDTMRVKAGDDGDDAPMEIVLHRK